MVPLGPLFSLGILWLWRLFKHTPHPSETDLDLFMDLWLKDSLPVNIIKIEWPTLFYLKLNGRFFYI